MNNARSLLLSLAVVAVQLQSFLDLVASFPPSIPVNNHFAVTNRCVQSARILQVSTYLNSEEAPHTGSSARSRTMTSVRRDESLTISVRRAKPDEIDGLSSFVAGCFAKKIEHDDENIQADDRVLLPLHQGWDYFISRWTIYAGMVQRLIVSSYRSGLEESRGKEVDGGSAHPLFVAEVSPSPHHPDIDSQHQINRGMNVVGVVEVAYGDCPVPFESNTRNAPFVCNLAVLPEYRGLGIGKALLGRAEEAAISGEGSPLQPRSPISEIWLETGYSNIPALRMYQAAGYICEGVDPGIRHNRHSYMRKRFSTMSPENESDILTIDKVGSKWAISYDYSDEERYVGKVTFIEKNFGSLAPIVAAVGTVLGIILF